MGSDPNFQLIETLFQFLFETLEKLSVLGQIGHVHNEPSEIILINRAFVFPSAPHNLSFPGGSSELFSQLYESSRHQRFGNGVAVIEHQRDQNFGPA